MLAPRARSEDKRRNPRYCLTSFDHRPELLNLENEDEPRRLRQLSRPLLFPLYLAWETNHQEAPADAERIRDCYMASRLALAHPTGPVSFTASCASPRWTAALRCVAGEDKVPSFDGSVTGEAGFVHNLVGRFAIIELSEPPATCRGVLS